MRRKPKYTPNLDQVVEQLLARNYGFTDIGEIFVKGLLKGKSDLPAYASLDSETNRYRRLQGKSIRKIRAYMLSESFGTETTGEVMDIPYQRGLESATGIEHRPTLNNNSLLGVVRHILEEHGTDGFAMIGEAVQQGSRVYLENNPIALTKNFYRVREYKSILETLKKV